MLMPPTAEMQAIVRVYLCGRVTIECSASGDETPTQAVLHFPGGLADFLASALEGRSQVVPAPWAEQVDLPDGAGRAEWALTWIEQGDGFLNTYANTIPTPQGGTHEAGLRAALVKGLRAYGELKKDKRAANVTADVPRSASISRDAACRRRRARSTKAARSPAAAGAA